MEIKTSEYRVWVEGATVYFEGTMRLSNNDAYAPIQEILSKVLASAPTTVTLDLTGLEFLNSSGINLFAKFTIEVRKLSHTGLAVRGSSRIPWQSKSLPNLKKLYPALDLAIS